MKRIRYRLLGFVDAQEIAMPNGRVRGVFGGMGLHEPSASFRIAGQQLSKIRRPD